MKNKKIKAPKKKKFSTANKITMVVMTGEGKPVEVYLSKEEAFSLMGQLGKIFTKPQITLPRPARDVFESETLTTTEHLLKGQPQPVPILLKTEYPEEGGIFNYMQDYKFPVKGFVTPEAAQANNIFKRFFIGQIRFLAKNPLVLLSFLWRKTRESYLDEFNQVGNIIMGQYFYKKIRYQTSCRELWKLSSTFFQTLGIKDQEDGLSRLLVTMLEYDNAYLLRLQDLANETTVQRLINNPVVEFKRLFSILKERDQNPKMHNHFGSALFLVRIMMLIPRVRKAYQVALLSVDWSKIQMDETDRYHCLRWNVYNFGGRTFEDRLAEFQRIHENKPPMALLMQR